MSVTIAWSQEFQEFRLNSMKASDITQNQTSVFPPVMAVKKSGRMQMTYSIKIKLSREKSEIEIRFPKVKFGNNQQDNKALLFIRIFGDPPCPLLSWVTIICSGPYYSGYKGSNIMLPEKSGNFSMAETMALGYPKMLIERTHPWLTAGIEREDKKRLDGLCSADFLAKNKDYNIESLPKSMGSFNFKHNSRKNILKITW